MCSKVKGETMRISLVKQKYAMEQMKAMTQANDGRASINQLNSTWYISQANTQLIRTCAASVVTMSEFINRFIQKVP